MPRASTAINLPKSQMTSLIDIVFQLLIYFMVTMALGTYQKRAEKVTGKEAQALLELPKVSRLAEISDQFSGYLIHITTAKKGPQKGQWIGYVLDKEVSTLDEADKDTLFHNHGPWPLRVAKQKLQKAVEDEIFISGGKRPVLTIRAAQQTEFGEILDILDFCDKDSINQVIFRLVKEEK